MPRLLRRRTVRSERQIWSAVEGQHVFVQYHRCRLWLLEDVQESEGAGAEAVDDRVRVDAPNPFGGIASSYGKAINGVLSTTGVWN